MASGFNPAEIFKTINNGQAFNKQQLENYFSKFDVEIERYKLQCSGGGKESDRTCDWISAKGQDNELSENESNTTPFYTRGYADQKEKCSGSTKEGDRTCETDFYTNIPILSKNFFKFHDKDGDGLITSSEFKVQPNPLQEKKSSGKGGDHYERGIDPARP